MGKASALLLSLVGLSLGAAAIGASAAPPTDDKLPAGLKVDRVVLLMRHGVRPPTKSPPMPDGTAADPWPAWPVNPGWLTPHGAQAIARLGESDRARFQALELLPARGCPAKGRVAVIADSDQRTIATAAAWLGTLAPGCAIPSEHKPQDEPDPLFNAIEDNPAALDPARADAAVTAAVGPAGIAALDAAERPLLQRLDRILCGGRAARCGVGSGPSAVEPAAPGKRPKLKGALDRASTVAQILLLEYADGKPMADVGWGRATAADVTALSHFHALEFRLLARPRPVALANMAGISARILGALGATGADAARVTMISGHDTNVANLGGLLDVHWQAPGFAADDPVPGGAIVLERLSDAQGSLYVRAVYRSQGLEQIRSNAPLATGGYRAMLPIPGCNARGIAGLCTLDAFRAKLTAN